MGVDLDNLQNAFGNDYYFRMMNLAFVRSGVHRVAVGVLAGTLAACGSSKPSPSASDSSRRLSVVVTTSQLKDFATVIGGPNVTVYSLLKPNVDAHDFEPSPADIDAIAQADVVVKNGVGLESWFDDVLKSADPKGVVVDASAGVATRKGGAHDEHGDEHAKEGGDEHAEEGGDEHGEEGSQDPHIWFDPRNVKVMVRNISEAFAAADDAHASGYAERERAYAKELDILDTEIAAKISALDNKKLITNHDAFGYYVDRYGLEFVGSVIPSFDTSAEISASALAQLVSDVKSQEVKAIFAETSLPAKAAAALAEEAGVQVVAGDDALYGDALGPEGSAGANYLAMMRHNTDTIVANLT